MVFCATGNLGCREADGGISRPELEGDSDDIGEEGVTIVDAECVYRYGTNVGTEVDVNVEIFVTADCGRCFGRYKNNELFGIEITNSQYERSKSEQV